MFMQPGTADFSAYRVSPNFVAVVAIGTTPTSGWRHEFREGVVPGNEVWFYSAPPLGYVLQVVTPFHVVHMLSLPAATDVVNVFHSGGNPEVVPISEWSAASRPVQAIIRPHLPPIAIFPADSDIDTDGLPVRVYEGEEEFSFSPAVSIERTALYYEKRLGEFESPEICNCKFSGLNITCKNKHYTATLRIRVATPQDIGGAVEDCLREAGIAAAVIGIVATLATGGSGFASAKAAFLPLFTSCLSQKLSGILSVDVDLVYECR